ncbi:hypothetical protein, partial [Mesorhizobium sp. M7A.T.Ca.TU.009.02.1.1]|uniref:hypothetical protein n=1 Tax=Mesorhizobium sp. M7A.T.Ca.TU.009.02.1.1 TaxID=2496791 RepID=UPI0019CF7C8A
MTLPRRATGAEGAWRSRQAPGGVGHGQSGSISGGEVGRQFADQEIDERAHLGRNIGAVRI